MFSSYGKEITPLLYPKCQLMHCHFDYLLQHVLMLFENINNIKILENPKHIFNPYDTDLKKHSYTM